MSAPEQKYFEAIGNVWIHNGVAHVELLSAHRGEEGKEPTPQIVQELVIPLPNFINFCEAMGNVLLEMEKQGVIERKKEGN